MKKAQRLAATEQLLIQRGCDPESAPGVASAAEKGGEPLMGVKLPAVGGHVLDRGDRASRGGGAAHPTRPVRPLDRRPTPGRRAAGAVSRGGGS